MMGAATAVEAENRRVVQPATARGYYREPNENKG
jgi:hypothetical protein